MDGWGDEVERLRVLRRRKMLSSKDREMRSKSWGADRLATARKGENEGKGDFLSVRNIFWWWWSTGEVRFSGEVSRKMNAWSDGGVKIAGGDQMYLYGGGLELKNKRRTFKCVKFVLATHANTLDLPKQPRNFWAVWYMKWRKQPLSLWLVEYS